MNIFTGRACSAGKVDTPGLGCADIERAAAITRHGGRAYSLTTSFQTYAREWPDLIYDYLKNRESLKHGPQWWTKHGVW